MANSIRIAIPFGFSFDRVLTDAVAVLGQPDALCVVLGPRDGAVAVKGSTVTWSDRGEPRSAEAGCPVTAVRLAPAADGVLDLAPAIAAVRAFAPDAIVLNGGITPVQGVLWAQEAPKYDIQRDGAVELRV